MKLSLISLVALFLFSCSTYSVLPKTSEIKISRDEAGKNCKYLGSIEGRTTRVHGTSEEALEDLKNEAVKKGATYVQIETLGAQSTAVRGQAYFCN